MIINGHFLANNKIYKHVSEFACICPRIFCQSMFSYMDVLFVLIAAYMMESIEIV